MSAPAPPRDASNPALSPASAPSSTRPAPSSPVLSRKSSTVRPTSNPVLTPAPASDLPAKRRHIIVYDFAYPNSDDRHRGLVLDTGNHGSNRSSASSGVTGFFGFRLNPFKSLAVPSEGVDGEGANSQRSSRASASSTSSTYHDAPEYSDEDEEGADRIAGAGAPPFRPGIYRAMYDFEPEGDAEMGLSEGQLVRVLGRGGGEGWVVVSDPDKGNGQALVPEGYLEFSHADEEDGGTTPADV
ncbi:hypothetical protein BOTBODRAFT_149058 [Botryobasidium botryosum FD-172 SS1]|uniref:SH3 domain-containing protein n=1 Tax=Botryobasidium botryosum (strain FD-172 SS1) TaxID=930990 RepID=A0A067M7E7_BOTB1|nr:hypothetical protein BOTBODRAFT_149058 [Botryobasidium botryosum FD-172 SS1]